MADGSITFSTALDNSELERQLRKETAEIARAEKKLAQQRSARLPLVEQSAQVAANLDRAQETLAHMRSGTEFFTAAAVKEQEQAVQNLQKEYDRVQSKVETYDAKIKLAEESLDRQKEHAGEIVQQLHRATSGSKAMGAAVARAEKHMDKFVVRIKGLARRVFVFTLIAKALRSVRDWFGKVYKSNDQAVTAVSKLRAALLTMVQPLVDVLMPAFTQLMEFLAKVASYGAAISAALFGTTVDQSKQAAENLYEETDALDKTGDAAKKAGKSLASFDEINQIGSKDAGSQADDEAEESRGKPDFNSVIGEKLNAITALVGGALLALGAILTFSGANVPLGLGLMALGAATLAATVAENWDYIINALRGPIGLIAAIISAALLVIGAILLFSGTDIPLGLGLMAAGAIGLAATIAANWDTIKNALQGPLGVVLAIVSAALLVIGAVLLFSGANIPLGLGLMVAGALGLATVIAANWDTVKTLLQGPIGVITAILSGALLVIGAIFTFSGANIPLGIALMAVGAAGLATAAAANWDTIKNCLQGPIADVVLCLSVALLAVGALLAFSGAALPLGIGLIAVGAVGLAASAALNWDAISNALGGTISALTILISGALLVIGVILCFTGVALPIGLSLIVAGVAGFAVAAVLNWDALKSKIQDTWDGIKDWWQSNVAKYFTAEYWADLGSRIIDGFLSGLQSAFEGVKKWMSGAMSSTSKIQNSYAHSLASADIPHLARGAVIPPNREFLAVLGDQRSGNNIEAPESAIEAAVARGMNRAGNSGGSQTVVLQIGEQEFGRLVYRLNNQQSQRIGVTLGG